MESQVRLYEVSLRDGLQNEPQFVPTESKIELVKGLIDAGFSDIEVTSFVSPRYIPQTADAEELLAALPRVEGVSYWALVPNRVGLERALAAGISNIATFMSVSETHNRKNVNRTVQESLEGLRQVVLEAKANGLKVRSYLSTVFGCPYEGDIEQKQVFRLVDAFLSMDVDQVVLGDTTGMGIPTQVRDILTPIQEKHGLERIAVHFHDTRGTALVNAYEAWNCGVRIFDGSIGGIGGCPYAPGATGNVATEDLAHLFQGMGLETGVSLDKACEVAWFMEGVLQKELPGRFQRYRKAKQGSSAKVGVSAG